ncbi:sulfatase family protein [Puniceicoccus vermicola]|uniref:Sulfatase-like hydrolase/transferase n=1 Tax=Puniceicoccus vermicola TaxID=388746 RepID=A0A7X1E4Z5_9BACT|nr:sulfatase-like hydrolase/transferase [Puniceicoccus vermicola]MBC2602523.1 sulfatase-like hydrolase/transferase [Puniceicoccus vermicola]
MRKTNILWIMTDQHNADCLSCLGHPVLRTPHIDSLAARGTCFTQAYCQYPQCTPSRISMLTGQYCKTSRQYGFLGNMGGEPAHLMNHFRDHGWKTGAVGKFHVDPLGMHFVPDFSAPTMSIDWFQAQPSDNHYGAYLEKHGLSYPTHETHGGQGDPPRMPEEPSAPMRSDVPYEHNLERWTADRTMDFISDCAEKEEPFIAWMSFERPHKPINIPKDEEDRIPLDRIPLDPPETEEQLLLLPRICIEGRMDICSDTWQTPDNFREVVRRYYTIIEMIDDQVGRVLAKLEELGLAENTAIAFCSDHGDMAGRKRIFDKCLHASSNQLVRIPLLLVPPRGQGQEGQVVDAPVENIDLYPTFCSWAGLDTPAHVEGHDLAPVCTGRESADPHRPAFCESYFRRAVVKDGWRLVHHVGGSVHELYHIAEDPLEYENLYLRSGHAEKVDALKHELILFLSGPHDETDTASIENAVLSTIERRRKFTHQNLHRNGTESGPYFICGRAIHALEWKHWTLFYRVDTREHMIFSKSDEERKDNLYGTPQGWVFGEMQDKLIDMLVEQHPALTWWEPEPLGSEMPTPSQVRAYLSLPLMQE